MKAIVGLLLLATVSCHTTTTGSTNSVLVFSEAPPGPPCSSFANHKGITAASFKQSCTVDAATADLLNLPVGEQYFAGTARVLCEDNRVMIWNNLGWGYENEWFAAFTEGGTIPQGAHDRCARNP